MHCYLKINELKLIIISLKMRPSPSAFSNCKWGPTENDSCSSLLSSKYHQVTQAHRVYLHNLYCISSLIFRPSATSQSRIEFLNLSTTDILGQIILCCGGFVLGIVGSLAESLSFIHQMLELLPLPVSNNQKCLQTVPNDHGGKK